MTKADVDKRAAGREGCRGGGPEQSRQRQRRRKAAPAAEKPAVPVPAPVAGDRTEERVRMSKRRATIAKRLVEAQQTAAMLTTFNEVDMSAVMALRERHKESFKARYGTGLGVASFFVKAAVAALREFPRLNAEIQGDEMVLKHYYDIGVAVGAAEGLVVPVLRDVGPAVVRRHRAWHPRVREQGEGRHAHARRSAGRHVQHHERRGLRVAHEHAHPQPAAGRHSRPARDQGPTCRCERRCRVIRPMMYTALTYDHRIVDGSEAVRFLVRIKELVEDPAALLIEG